MSTEQFDKRSAGEITRQELKKKGVKSPSTKYMIKITDRFKIAVKEPFKNKIEEEKFILRMKAKYGV